MSDLWWGNVPLVSLELSDLLIEFVLSLVLCLELLLLLFVGLCDL